MIRESRGFLPIIEFSGRIPKEAQSLLPGYLSRLKSAGDQRAKAGLPFVARCFGRLVVVLLTLVLFTLPAFAQGYVPYRWVDADLALLYPAGWDISAVDSEVPAVTLAGDDLTITLAVLPVTNDDAALRLALEEQVAALSLLPLNYTLDKLYGRGGLRIDAVSADRSLIGVGAGGECRTAVCCWLPDARLLPDAALDDYLRIVTDSLVFGGRAACAAELPPGFQPASQRPACGLAGGKRWADIYD